MIFASFSKNDGSFLSPHQQACLGMKKRSQRNGESDVLTLSCLLSECELVTHSPWLSSGDLLATAGVALD